MRSRTDLPKPMVSLDERPLLGHVLDRISEADPSRLVLVAGYRRERIEAFLRDSAYDFPIDIAVNESYERENGYSLLRAAPLVDGRFVLAMADHVVAPTLYGRAADHDGLGLCTDVSPPPGEDADEVTAVRIEDGRIVDIGKDVRDPDAIDTGVFSLTPAIFDALEERTARRTVTVTDGVKALIDRGRTVEPIDVTGHFWIDVDTPADLDRAERILSEGGHRTR